MNVSAAYCPCLQQDSNSWNCKYYLLRAVLNLYNKHMSTLLIIHGYAGAGKSTAAKLFATRNGYALLNQDVFLFQLNAFSKKEGGLTEKEHSVAIKNMHDCALNYMKQKRKIVIEGALVSISDKDPLDVRDFIKLGKRMDYKVVVVTMIADEEIRIKRQRKRKYVVPKNIDLMLRKAIKEMDEEIKGEIVIDTKNDSVEEVVEKLEKLV